MSAAKRARWRSGSKHLLVDAHDEVGEGARRERLDVRLGERERAAQEGALPAARLLEPREGAERRRLGAALREPRLLLGHQVLAQRRELREDRVELARVSQRRRVDDGAHRLQPVGKVARGVARVGELPEALDVKVRVLAGVVLAARYPRARGATLSLHVVQQLAQPARVVGKVLQMVDLQRLVQLRGSRGLRGRRHELVRRGRVD